MGDSTPNQTQAPNPKLRFYNAFRAVPGEAKKAITGGRLKGMTDINPMWRIKSLTEMFGPCGIGWYSEITKQWIEPSASGESAAFCNINLFVKEGDGWSKPIPGTGGAMFVENETRGPHTSDECFKMAETDAISVACKKLGIGADVYWEKDRTKYDQSTDGEADAPQDKKPQGNKPTATTLMRAEMRTWYTEPALDRTATSKYGSTFAELNDADVKRMYDEVKAARDAKSRS